MLSETITPLVDYFVQRLDVEDDLEDFGDDVADALDDAADDVADAFDDAFGDDSNGNSWPDDRPDEIGDYDENQQNAMIGTILIGFGIVVELASWFTFGWFWQAYIGEVLSLGALGVWVWGMLKWYDTTQEATMKVNFRAWRINLLVFAVSLVATIYNVAVAWAYTNLKAFSILSWGAAIGSALGTVAIAVGIYFSWFLKNIWYAYDAAGTLAGQDFDWFKWTDRSQDGELEEAVDDIGDALDDFADDVEDAFDETLLA